MAKDFDKMQSVILKNLISQFRMKNGKEPSGDAKKELEAKSFAVATDQYKKKYGKSPKEELLKNLVIQEVADIETHIEEQRSNEMTIKGTAIKVGTSRNGITYTASELRKAAASWIGKPFIKDHNTNTVSSVMGKITHSYFDEQSQSVKFEAKVDKSDPDAHKIRMGYVKTVSIGAGVEDLEETDDGKIAKGIEGHELSLVVVPGVIGAEIASISEKLDMIKRGESMSEDIKTDFVTKEDFNGLLTELKSLKDSLVAKETKSETVKEEKKDDASKAILEQLKLVQEELAKVKEVKAQPKGMVNPEVVAEMEKKCSNLVFERATGGKLTAMWNDSKANHYSAGELGALLKR